MVGKVAEATARHAAVSAGNPRMCEANQEVETEHRAKPAEKHLRLQLDLVFLEWL